MICVLFIVHVMELCALEQRRNEIRQQLHQSEISFGNARTRDLSINTDPLAVVNIPPGSSCRARLHDIEHDQRRLHQSFASNQEDQARTLSRNQNRHRNPDNVALPVRPITPEVFLSPIRSFGGSQSLSSSDFFNVHQPSSSAATASRPSLSATARGGDSFTSTCDNTTSLCHLNSRKKFSESTADVHAAQLAHNRLLSPQRSARTTLMLSGMGFNGHCTDIALGIVKALNTKHK